MRRSNGDRYIVVVEDFTLVGDVLVGNNDHRTIFIEAVDQLEQVIDFLPIHRQIAQLVDDEQIILQQLGDFLLQFAFELGQLQCLDQGQGGTKHTL